MKNNLNHFVRFGGLNLKKQKGFSTIPRKGEGLGWHAPPAPRGFYAMPKIAQELFLVGSIDVYQPGLMPKFKSDSDEDYLEWDRRRRKAKSALRKEFYKDKGFIWHHLEEQTELNEIVARHGSWVKTSIQEWEKAFSKMSLEFRYGEDKGSGWDLSTKSINEPARSGLVGMYSKDHCEVFFDEKV